MTTPRPKVPKWLAALAVIVLGAGGFFVLALLQGPSTLAWGQWGVLLHVAAVFASLGCIFGVVLAFDGRSDLAVADQPALRTVLAALFGAVTILIFWSAMPDKFHPAWALAGAVIGAGLGWSGWRWARYVNEGL